MYIYIYIYIIFQLLYSFYSSVYDCELWDFNSCSLKYSCLWSNCCLVWLIENHGVPFGRMLSPIFTIGTV